MRSTRLIAAALLVGLSGLSLPWQAESAEPCAWQEPAKASRLFVDTPVAIFRHYYDADWATCVAGSGREAAEVEIQWRVGEESRTAPVKTEKVSLQKSGREGPLRLQAKLFPSAVCDVRKEGDEVKSKGARVPRGKLVVTGLPGEERLSELVPLRVAVIASGPLAPLAYVSPPVDFACPACETRAKGSLRVRESREGALTLEGELDAAWFECARRGATLTLLGFGGRTPHAATRAIRPDLRLQGLEKAFVRQGDKYVLNEPLPMPQLCLGDGNVWSFELWGQGELKRASGGGRSIHTVRCR